jgi:hypothetical protein
VPPCESKDRFFVGRAVDLDWELSDQLKEAVDLKRVQALSPLTDEQHVSQLEPPMSGHESRFSTDSLKCAGRGGRAFVWETP